METAPMLFGWWLNGFAGLLVARYFWNKSFDRKPLTWGTMILCALGGWAGAAAWVLAITWALCWLADAARKPPNSRFVAWWSTPVFKRKEPA